MRLPLRSRPGITLVEITVTITVIVLLLAAVFAAIDPLKRTSQARNSRRAGDVDAISKAAAVRTVRAQPSSIDDDPMTWQMIGTATEGCDMLCGPSYAVQLNTNLGETSASNFVEVPKEVFAFDEAGKFSLSAWAMQMQQGRPFYSIFTTDLISLLPRKGLIFYWMNTPAFTIYEDLIDQDLPFTLGGEKNPLDRQITWYSEEDVLGDTGFQGIGVPRHLAITYDGTNDPENPVVGLYVNGKKYDAVKEVDCYGDGCTPPEVLEIEPIHDYLIGHGLIGASWILAQPISGFLDDFRIYEGTLNDDEVRKLYEGEKFSDRPGLTMKGRWTFNEPPGYREGYAKNEVDSLYDGIYKSTQGVALPGRGASFAVPGGAETLPACLDLSSDLVDAGYIPSIPVDPKTQGDAGITGYAVNRIGGSVVARACNAEGEGPRATGDPPFIEAAH